jgi:hypothetical protein
MKSNFEDISPGEFFEYRESGDSNEYYLYQKLQPNPNYNCILINKGQLCNIYTNSQMFNKVTAVITVEREIND